MAKSSKISEITSSLRPSEIKRLGEFLSSPFYNKNKTILKVYELILNDKDCVFAKDSEEIFSLIFPGEKYNYQKFRTLISEFTGLLEKFIAVTEFEKKPFHEKSLLLTSLQERELPKSFKMVLNELDETLKNEFSRNEDYYLNRFRTDTMELVRKGKNLDSE